MLDYVNENANTFRTVTGELHELAGRIKVFDELIRVSETLDSALVAQLKTVSDSIKDSAAAKYVKEYVSIAEKIAAKGVEYIEKEINRVSGIISGGKITPDKKTELMIKKNILKSFGKQ
jgi:protein disulfide-isomerase A6